MNTYFPSSPPTIIDRDVRDRNTIDLPSWNAFDGCRYRSGQQQFGKREVEKKKKKGRKSTVEQLWTRLFIPINSLPSRIPLHVRYFPRNLHRGRSIFEAGRYSEPWPRFGLRPFEIATNETNLCWESVEDRPRGGLKLGGEQRAERKGGMEKKGSHLGRPKTLPLPLATTRLRNS